MDVAAIARTVMKRCQLSLLMLAFAMPAQAEKEWQFSLSPYAWIPSVQGDIGGGSGSPSVPVDISPSDVIDDIEAVVMLVLDAKKGRHGIYADIFHADIDGDIELLPAPIGLRLRTEVQNQLLTLAYQYELYNSDGAVADVLFGARYWAVESTLTFGGGSGPLAGRRFTSSESWTDPVVAFKGYLPLGGSRFYLQAGGGIGGFGVGSDMFYEVSGVIGYRWSDSIGTSFGYRLFDVDYNSNSFSYDIKQQGPQFGLTWSF